MKEFIITSRQDFKDFVQKTNNYFEASEKGQVQFVPFRIISKKLVKDKTPQHHRYYFRCIAELKDAFESAGYIYNTEQVHHFVKTASGYTKMDVLKDSTIVCVPKSIADNSEDVNSEEISKMCEWIKIFAATKLDYLIED